jgi:DNA-binding PadR family transcriptional regulator
MERELLLLGLLRQNEMHGYQLAELLAGPLETCTDLKRSTAYFLLDKMDKAGWVTFEEEQEGNRPTRRVYRLTEAGEQTFQRLLRENLSAYEPARFVSDTGLAFLDALSQDEALALLSERAERLQEQLSAARQVPEHPGKLQWLVEHRVKHLEQELAWLQEVIQRLE